MSFNRARDTIALTGILLKKIHNFLNELHHKHNVFFGGLAMHISVDFWKPISNVYQLTDELRGAHVNDCQNSLYAICKLN